MNGYPQLMQTKLKMMRQTAEPDDDEAFKDFIIATADLPDNCIVQLSEGHATLLVDDDGHPLAFA
jgi:hypothetical protein